VLANAAARRYTRPALRSGEAGAAGAGGGFVRPGAAGLPRRRKRRVIPARSETQMATALVRIGIGFDIHRLVEGRRLVLAGVEAPGDRGALAHSDGDVVFHAVADAVLGAAGLGDLGDFFPETDEAWAGADSAMILGRVVEMARRAGWAVAGADANVLLERPKLGGLKARMRERLAEVLGLAPDAVGLKARTLEGLGPIGEGEAVAAQAVVLLAAAPRQCAVRRRARTSRRIEER